MKSLILVSVIFLNITRVAAQVEGNFCHNKSKQLNCAYWLDFKNGDFTVELYKKHAFYSDAMEMTKKVLSDWREGEKLPEKSFPYELSGLEGIGKYIKDYSTLLTGGQTGNLMFM